MKKFLAMIPVFLILALCLKIGPAFAGEIDLLLQRLVEKGVLAPEEAEEIKTETQEQVKKEIAQGKYSSFPEWVQNIKFKGDFRLRYQYNHDKTIAGEASERHRGRYRLRLGLGTRVNDKIMVGFGLATGGTGTTSKDYVRSTNQSFQDSFSKKSIILDYAYAKYSPYSWVDLIGGKMLLKDALWEPGDLMWDTDITPEGVVLAIDKKLDSTLGIFSRSGFFVLDEKSDSGDDPVMFMQQAGLNFALSPDIKLKGAFTYYQASVQDIALDNSSGSNTLPLEDFSIISPALEMIFKQTILDIPQFKLFGEYLLNTHAPGNRNRSGFMLGFGFGAEKVSGWGDWQFKYNFARLEKDATLDILPDSDRYDGKTGIRSHEVAISFGLGRSTSLDVDVYRSQLLTSPGANPETIFQLDWNMKF